MFTKIITHEYLCIHIKFLKNIFIFERKLYKKEKKTLNNSTSRYVCQDSSTDTQIGRKIEIYINYSFNIYSLEKKDLSYFSWDFC